MTRRLLIYTCLFLACSLAPLRAEQLDEQRLLKVQMAYILNFAKLISWPSSPETQGDFVIATYGGNPFGRQLDVLAGKRVGRKKIVIKHCTSLTETANCQLLYIHPCQQPQVEAISTFLADKNVLTISSCPGFLSYGGTIELHLVGSHVLFSVNQYQAQQQGLDIPSQVLALAREVLVSMP